MNWLIPVNIPDTCIQFAQYYVVKQRDFSTCLLKLKVLWIDLRHNCFQNKYSDFFGIFCEYNTATEFEIFKNYLDSIKTYITHTHVHKKITQYQNILWIGLFVALFIFVFFFFYISLCLASLFSFLIFQHYIEIY